MKPITPPLVVPRPCHADWQTMTGDERKRFCAECGKHVYNLSAMSEREAQAFADETGGRECVAYVRIGDGKMQSPGLMERCLLRLAGRRPRLARILVPLLPAALAACVQRPTGGVPVPLPGTAKIPPHTQLKDSEGRIITGEAPSVEPNRTREPLMLGVPARESDVPKPGRALLPPDKAGQQIPNTQ